MQILVLAVGGEGLKESFEKSVLGWVVINLNVTLIRSQIQEGLSGENSGFCLES